MGVPSTGAKDKKLTRRSLLKSAGAVGAAAAAFTVFGRPTSYAIAGNATKLRLSWTEFAACHAPVAFAVSKGFYAKRDLDVELFYQGASGQTLVQSIATGKTDAGAGLLLDWIKPLEQGLEATIFVGSHGGCTRLLASQASGVKTLEDLKGKTIVSYDVAAPPKHSFQVALAKAGLDPNNDVNWTNVPFDLVGEAVGKGDADALAHLDPWATSYKDKFDLFEVYNTQIGVFEGRVCCVLGVNNDFLAANKDAIRRLAEADIEIHEYASEHPDEVAKWFVDNLNPGFAYEQIRGEIASWVLHNHPVGAPLTEQVRLAAEDMALIKVLDPTTVPADFAKRVTVDILA